MGIHPEQGLFVLQVRSPTELSVSKHLFLRFILHNETPLGAPQKTNLRRLASPLRMMTKMFNKASCVTGAPEFHGPESPNCSLLFLVLNIHGIFSGLSLLEATFALSFDELTTVLHKHTMSF